MKHFQFRSIIHNNKIRNGNETYHYETSIVGRIKIFFFAVKTFFYEKFGQKSGCVLYMGMYYTQVNTVCTTIMFVLVPNSKGSGSFISILISIYLVQVI